MGRPHARSQSGCNYRLRLEDSDGPSCRHGPTLLFDRLDTSGRVTASFYACSACRDRRQCSFYQPLHDVARGDGGRLTGGADAVGQRDAFTDHCSCYSRTRSVLLRPTEPCLYCHDCDAVSYVDQPAIGCKQPRQQEGTHTGHKYHLLTADTVQQPSTILVPKEIDQSNAQFFFATPTTDFVVACLKRLRVRHVVCIGSPRLHEAIKLQQTNSQCDGSTIATDNASSQLQSFLLDIDNRFRHFFGPDEFAHYNMFNHYFFAGSAAERNFAKFCSGCEFDRVAIVVDPPYGGMLEALAASLGKISRLFAAAESSCPLDYATSASDSHLPAADVLAPCLIFLPYYLEPKVVAHFSGFSMLDYRVGYDNHRKYRNRAPDATGGPHGRPSKSSAARVFTNVRPDLIELPSEEGYRFCDACRRWTWPENKHCVQCNACTTKHGRTYVHCDKCKRCVKPSWKHCEECGRCVMVGEGSRHACRRLFGATAAAAAPQNGAGRNEKRSNHLDNALKHNQTRSKKHSALSNRTVAS